jgi:hypothetical protein
MNSVTTLMTPHTRQAVVSGGVHAANLTWTAAPSNAKVMVTDLTRFEFPEGVKALQYGDDATARVRATLVRSAV